MTQTATEPSTERQPVYNHIQLRGRLGKNPAQVNLKAPVCFDLAVGQGTGKEKMWLPVKCWGELATSVLSNQGIYRGVMVEVGGRLTSEKYNGKVLFAVVASSVEVVKL